jgi:polysaccharide export outer membrane protein
MDNIKSYIYFLLVLIVPVLLLAGCGGASVSTDQIVRVQEVGGPEKLAGLGESEREAISRLRQYSSQGTFGSELQDISSATQKFTIEEYLGRFHDPVNSGDVDYTVGGSDILSIIVYEEPDLTRKNIRVSRDGSISFPFLGRVPVEGLTTSQIEEVIADKLAEGQLLLDAQVAVLIDEYRSKKYQALGEIRRPGSYSLQAEERLLDAISEAGGVDPETAGKELMVVRTIKQKKPAAETDGTQPEGKEAWGSTPTFNGDYGPEEQPSKIIITIELERLLRGNDLISNIALHDNDVIYLPKAEFFYIMGQVKAPGSYKLTQKDLTLVGAISTAGWFTSIAARNKTRIIRVEDGVEKIITIKVDAITSAGRKIQDVQIKADDIIIVPESFF